MRTDTTVNTLTGEVTETPRPYTLEEAIQLLKARRDVAWNAGALLPGGLRIQTDSESQNNLLGAIKAGEMAAALQQPFEIRWSLGGGQFVPLNLAGLQSVGLVLFQHRQAVMSRYEELYTAISAAADIDSALDQINEGWPA